MHARNPDAVFVPGHKIPEVIGPRYERQPRGCGGCVFRIFGRYGNRVDYYIVAGYVFGVMPVFYFNALALKPAGQLALGPVRAACAVAGNVSQVCQRGHIDTTNADEKDRLCLFHPNADAPGSEVRVFGQHMGFWFLSVRYYRLEDRSAARLFGLFSVYEPGLAQVLAGFGRCCVSPEPSVFQFSQKSLLFFE